MLKREAQAVWTGGLKDGSGRLSSTSGVLKDTPYSFTTRFEQAPGTNPEELVAAAHAGCFSMALSAVLGESGLKPERIETTATVTLEKLDAGWTLTRVHLDLSAKVPGADPAALRAAADKAKAGCPISRVLKSEITLSTRFE
ncbi:MAG: OsmC family protein [Candidatus Eisenbacteria bacterium]